MLATVLEALARAQITPGDGARMARRLGAGLRAVSRRAQFTYSKLRGLPQIALRPDDRERPDQMVDVGLPVHGRAAVGKRPRNP
jgi:hypothetical protein